MVSCTLWTSFKLEWRHGGVNYICPAFKLKFWQQTQGYSCFSEQEISYSNWWHWCLSDPKFGQEEEFGAQHSLTLFMLLNQFQKHAHHSYGHMPSGNNRQCGNSWFQLMNLPVVNNNILGGSLFLFEIPTLGTVTSYPYHICTLSTNYQLTRLHLDHASLLMPFTCAQLQISLSPWAHVLAQYT